MRIAQVAPLQVAVPPTKYGGTERVIANLTDALVEMGHDVTLYAAGDSHTRARLVPFVRKALTFDPGIDVYSYHVALLAEVYRHAGEYDVIHSHLDYLTLPFAAAAATPTVITLHLRLDTSGQMLAMRAYPDANYVSISDSQRAPLPDVHWAATVYHGIDVDRFPFYPDPGDYLAFIGRISPEKGPIQAIEIAKAAGMRLKIGAKVDPKDRKFFKEKVEPLLRDPLVEFLGPVDERKKRDLMGHALALLLPIDWPEPFGMVFIEALACGTPVLTRPCGSVPEILRDGVTGCARADIHELAACVREVAGISRAGCRAYVEERFSSERMAGDYLAVYSALAHSRSQGRMV
jgi:glycosyltransferase involved in cell wall biosynthesis